MKTIQLPDEVITPEQIRLISFELSRHKLKLVRNLKTALPGLSPLTAGFIEANNFLALSADDIKKLQTYLTDSQRRPCLTITTTHELSAAAQMRITDWLRVNVAKQVLCSFRSDVTMIAGVQLQTPKTMYDHSLSSGESAGKAYLRKVLQS